MANGMAIQYLHNFLFISIIFITLQILILLFVKLFIFFAFIFLYTKTSYGIGWSPAAQKKHLLMFDVVPSQVLP